MTGAYIYGNTATGIVNVNIGSASDPTATINVSGEIGSTSVAIMKVKVFSGFTYDLLTTNNKQIGDLTIDGTLSSTGGSGPIIVKGGLTVGSSGVMSTKVSFRFGGSTGYGTVINIPAANLNVKDIEFRTTGNYTLANNTTINGTLSFPTTASFSGKLYLGAFNFTAPTVTGGNTTSSWAATNGAGRLVIQNIGSTAVSFPIGSTSEFLPITSFSNTGTADDFGAKVSGATPTCTTAANALTATWDVSETTAGGSTAAMTVQYNAGTAKGASFTTGGAFLFHCNGSTADVTGTVGASGAGPYTNSITGVTSFSPFGVATSAVLHVELSNFQVKRNQTAALLTWTTTTEKDNATFNIEQSTNGTDFQTIGLVKGNGTTAKATNYYFEHKDPSVGVNYYRLKQIDFNGTATYSAVRSVVFGKNGLVVKTTLVHDALDIVVSDVTATPLSIFNISGQQVMTINAQSAQHLDVSTLPIGLYLIRTATGDVGRFVKQ